MTTRRFGMESVGTALAGALCLHAAACGGTEQTNEVPLPHTLYVAHEGTLTAYSIETGFERPGSVADVATPVAMQALHDGTVLTNMSSKNEILAVDGKMLREIRRIPSSSQGGTRPVDSYISPDHNGKSYWVALNDGNMTAGSTTAIFVALAEGSTDRLKPVGEVTIGNGHHQAAFSATKERMAASSFSSCDDVISLYDYSDIKNIQVLKTITATDLGYDGSTMAKTCDPAESVGIAMRPHGCATSALSGTLYCNVAGAGLLAAIDIDADPPTFTTITTTGKGAGYAKAGKGGEFVYTIQNEPREGTGGVSCQIGQLLTIDAQSDAIVHELPLFYKGPGCTDMLIGTDEETAGPNHIRITPDGMKMFIALSGGFGVATARVRQHLVIDLATPSSPVQLASIEVGASTGQRGSAITGDGKLLFVADSIDGTVSQIDIATLAVTRTLTVKATPLQVTTYGPTEGPSLQIGPVH